ncbi:MAG: diguanylate cyclase [Oscillospiraceae bacterium]|nr:diguanylate cyclase [Oscillospiraceae bacterium]
MDKHDTLLVASSSAEHRMQLRSVLQGRYHLLEARGIRQMLLLIEQNASCVAAVLLDVSDLSQEDRKLLTSTQEHQALERVPVILLCREASPELLGTAASFGAADVIPVTYEPQAMLRRIETVVELHLHRISLANIKQEQADHLRHSNETLVDVLSSIIEYRSVESGQHILRIRHFTKVLLEEVARCCPEYQLTERDVALITSASAMHDIGKIAIPDAILMKPGRLTPEEMETMRTHSLTGCHILDSLGDIGDPEYMRYAHNICHYHHERWDGGGYPEGIAGDEIPICAQVVGIADVYDALTSKRVYKDAYSVSRAVNMILQGECGAFSPKLLECFKHVTGDYEALAHAYADGLSPKKESMDFRLPGPMPQTQDSMERVRAKYFALVHYIDGLLIELDMTQGLFHLVYNPYPELAWLQNVSTLQQTKERLLQQVILPQQREEFERFLTEGIGAFLEKDLRRQTQYFRLRSQGRQEGQLYEVTLLRIHPLDSQRRTLAVLCRRVEQEPQSEQPLPIMPDSTFFCRNDENFTLVRLGAHMPHLAGYSREELETLLDNRLLELIEPEDRDRTRRQMREQFVRSNTAEVEYQVRAKDGSRIWVRNKSRLSTAADGQEYLNVYLTDITKSKKAYNALEEQLKRYEIILAQTENVLFEWDMAEDVIRFSETGTSMFGFPTLQGNVREQLRQGFYFHPDDLPQLLEAVKNLETNSDYEMLEARMAASNGRYLWFRLRCSAIRSSTGKLTKMVGIIINIDEEKQAARQLQDSAQRDNLTKLLNKKAAREAAEKYLLRQNADVSCALLIIDLDNFKQVNDRYGHLFGDSVLTQAAREIEKMFRLQDIVARIGGDEFLVLMRGYASRELLENRCSRLIRAFRNIFRESRHQLPLSCSIGIALAPEHGSTYVDLFQHADQALYQAKAAGKDTFRFYDSAAAKFPIPAEKASAVSGSIDSDREPGLAGDNIVRYAFQRLYGARDAKNAIDDILALMGKKMNVSRVYIFENSDDNRFCSNTYEWCNEGIWPEIDNLQNISYETDIPGYEQNFNEEGIFYCPDIRVLPKEAYDILEPQGVKSMLQCAIREGGVFRGYIGFDECVEQRLWTKEQINTLTYFSEMLSVFLLKQRRQEDAMNHAQELSTILDNQNAWIYIIDPDTCRLKYLNAKTRQLAPDVCSGMTCYQALMGKEERCPGCPALDIRSKISSSARMYNEQFGIRSMAEATLIRWRGEESCLLTCRELPED